jgi:hypothetical protein
VQGRLRKQASTRVAIASIFESADPEIIPQLVPIISSLPEIIMTYDQKSNLPSYEESVTGNSFQDHRPDGQRILDQLTTVRAQQIRSTVNTQIYPVIARRAERGLSQTVLALIPSNIIAVDLSANPSGFTQGTHITSNQ